MNYLKANGTPFTLADKTYDLVFSLNVMAEIYDKYGSTAAFLKEFNDAIKGAPMQAVGIFKWVLCVLINDAIEEQNAHTTEKTEKLTERQIGRMLKVKDYAPLQHAIVEAWKESMPVPDESDGDDDDVTTAAEEEAEKN